MRFIMPFNMEGKKASHPGRGNTTTEIFIISCMLLVLCMALPFNAFAAGAAGGVEDPGACKHCGMDRTVFAQSRMLIVYADGATVGVCSIHCAAVEMKQNKDKQVRSIMVADYTTKELIDAKTATWTIGGTKQGVMTSQAKWAFAGVQDAQKFVQENGGEITSFIQAMKAAGEETGDKTDMPGKYQSHAEHMGAGSQMIFNPGFGDDIYHTHPAGMWMVNYKFMHMRMSGLRDGTNDVSVRDVIPMNGTKYGYMMAPTEMTMKMHMVMVMYGVNDRLTVMAMTTYLENEMKMLMNMGMGRGDTQEPPMQASGLGDSELRGIYKINKYLVGSLGLSIPTGGIDKEFVTMNRRYRMPYDMQLGSGTYDLKPAVTYSALSDDAKWNWGGQAMYTYHMGKNDHDYSLGDSLKVTSWIQHALGRFTPWLRLAYSNTKQIEGRDPEIDKLLNSNPMMGASSPDADPKNYGGRRLDGMIGVSVVKGPFSIGVEGGAPLYQDLNGLQLKTKWFINAGIQVMF